MSKAMKCDRCGKLYVLDEKDEDERLVFTEGTRGLQMPLLNIYLISCNNYRVNYDLCSKCANKLIRWINNPDETVCQGGE